MPRLLFALLRQRFTGTVTLGQREPAGERTIWVRGGMPVFCDWVSEPDRLGDMLLMSGSIDIDGLERALATAAEAGKLLGEVLVNLGLLDERGRTRALREQCTRKLVHLAGGVACLAFPFLIESAWVVLVMAVGLADPRMKIEIEVTARRRAPGPGTDAG